MYRQASAMHHRAVGCFGPGSTAAQTTQDVSHPEEGAVDCEMQRRSVVMATAAPQLLIHADAPSRLNAFSCDIQIANPDKRALPLRDFLQQRAFREFTKTARVPRHSRMNLRSQVLDKCP